MKVYIYVFLAGCLLLGLGTLGFRLDPDTESFLMYPAIISMVIGILLVVQIIFSLTFGVVGKLLGFGHSKDDEDDEWQPFE